MKLGWMVSNQITVLQKGAYNVQTDDIYQNVMKILIYTLISGSLVIVLMNLKATAFTIYWAWAQDSVLIIN